MGSDAVLTLNAGSSSLKFGLFAAAGPDPEEWLRGQISGIGGDARLKVESASGETLNELDLVDSTTHTDALRRALELLPNHREFDEIVAVGHRVVFGGPVPVPRGHDVRSWHCRHGRGSHAARRHRLH